MGSAEVSRPTMRKKQIQKEYGLREKSTDTRGEKKRELGEVQSQNLILDWDWDWIEWDG